MNATEVTTIRKFYEPNGRFASSRSATSGALPQGEENRPDSREVLPGRRLQHQPLLRFSLALLDILAVNFLFFQLVRAVVLQPLQFYTTWEVIVWAALLLGVLTGVDVIGVWEFERSSKPRLWLQSAALIGFVVYFAAKSNEVVTAKGWDFSWLRPEVIKVTYWIKMLAPLSPGFTALYAVVVLWLLVLAIRTPRNAWLRWVPTVGALLLIGKTTSIFAPYVFAGSETGIAARPAGTLLYYLLMFAGPASAVAFFMWLRSYSLAFRLIPLTFHMAQIALHYMGTLPVASIYEVMPFGDMSKLAVSRNEGVSVFFPPPGEKAGSSYLFLRKLLVTPQSMYLNFGPTCGMYAIDRQSRRMRTLPIPGLMRDLQLSQRPGEIWGLNWLNGDFVSIRAEPLEVLCQRDLFEMGITTPYNMIVDGDRLYISNVTRPIVAEFGWDDPQNSCSLKLRRYLDLHSAGFTKFTDGAYGMHLDRETDHIYLVAGFMADENISAVVEIDLESFTISRSVRLTAGNPIFPINGRRSVWVPSYYTAEMHEISLDSMTVRRTVPAGPNLVSLVQDEKRGLFYGLCRAPGTLQVIEDASGRIVRSVYVGAKPEPLWFDRDNDRLFLASGTGIIEVDLPVFLGEDRQLDLPEFNSQ